MKFEQITPTAGDCTAWYKVTDYKANTIGELIEEVLQDKQEWGYIKVLEGPDAEWWNCPQCEYRYGKLISLLPENILSKKIISIEANGGWTAMDYHVSVES